MGFWQRMFPTPIPATVLRCSFCHKTQRDVIKLVTGPEVNICNECTAICASLVAEDTQAVLQKALENGEALECRLCHETKPSVQLAHVPNRGPVCFTCVATIKVAVGRDWEFRQE